MAVVSALTPLTSLPDIIYDAPFYTMTTGEEVGLSHLFYVKLKEEGDVDELISLAADKGVEIIGSNEYMPLWYTLACTNESVGNALEMANLFYETGKFLSCQPDLMGVYPDSVNDTYFGQQWNLDYNSSTQVDINYLQARAVTTGSNAIIIAVLDQGIQKGHEDIPNLCSVSYNTTTGQQPSVVFGNHGTACAGIIGAAANNAKGVAGIAPDCMLMDVSDPLISSPNGAQDRADGFNWAWRNGAAVISNSWRSTSNFELIEDAIYNTLTQGRGGKGTVVVFSAGNNNNPYIERPKTAYPDIIVVGASNRNGKRIMPGEWNSSQASCYGNELDIMAPGIYIPSTDRIGAPGYSTTDYTMSFSGTSAACPHVAGVAGLILSVNPELTQREVSDIIEKTARKMTGYTYTNKSGRSNGTWNNETGYGLVDTYAAVLKAQEMNYNNDLHLTNRDFSDYHSFFTYKWIYLTNVNVQQGGNLVLEAGLGIKIIEPFSVHADASCTMQTGNTL